MSPSGELTGAFGALGMADTIVSTFTGKSIFGTLYDMVFGGLRIDPEARLRLGEGFQITPEDRRRAEAQRNRAEINESNMEYARKHGISEAEARRLCDEAARRAPPYPEIGPAR
jgi:hypothetical protein